MRRSLKIKPGFLLREIAGQPVVVAVGPACAYLNGVVNLNQSGAMLWRRLAEGATREDLIQLLLEKYDVDPDSARRDVDEFLDPILKAGFLE